MMAAVERMKALYQNETYSSKQSHKRKPQQIQPAVQYNINQPALTDKQLDLYLLQHKHRDPARR